MKRVLKPPFCFKGALVPVAPLPIGCTGRAAAAVPSVLMEKNTLGRRYETRKSTRAEEPLAKSRIDWRRTRQSSRFLDSEEEDDEIASQSEEELETSSEDDMDEKEQDASVLSNSRDDIGRVASLPASGTGYDGTAGEDKEEENINVGKRKRSRPSVVYDSDESDDSDIVRKVFAKRNCVVDDEDLANAQEQNKSPAEEATSRRQKRLAKLQELSQQRSRQSYSVSECGEDTEDDVGTLDDSCQSPFSQAETSDTSDGDSMKDFIVEEEEGDGLPEENLEENEGKPPEKKKAASSTLLEKHMPFLSRVDHFVHFQRVVKAFLINAIDKTFLISLYEGERQKRYAKDMLTSLHYLDDRFIQPRLANLLARSRWKQRYKERVDSYPNIHITLRNPVKRSCEACELQRYCNFQVTLSGKLYNNETMEIDDFMLEDRQILIVGSVCGERARIYHDLKHFKYKLYQNCFFVMKKESQDEPVKDTVDRVFSLLDDDGWIQKQYKTLEDYMDSADFFQDEKMD
nr:coiled-coil domain-containing protein 82 isoform X1 [Pogona vitticeps]